MGFRPFVHVAVLTVLCTALRTVPNITFKPKVEAKICSPSTQEMLCFLCIFDPPQGQREYFFEVEWSIKRGNSKYTVLHQSVPVKKGRNSDNMTMLTEEDLKSHGYYTLGFTLICSVMAKEDVDGLPSYPQTSEHKYCGFEVLDKNTIQLTNNEVRTVAVRLTVPFRCTNHQPNCSIYLSMSVPKSDHCEITDLVIKGEINSCRLKFSNDDVNMFKEFKITSRLGYVSQKRTYMYDIQLRTQTRFNQHRFFENFIMDPIHVLVTTDTQTLSGKTCHYMNHRHMMTFEQTKYDIQNDRVFVLYKNANLKQQVQIQTSARCGYGSSIYCNCAVAVAVGRDVFTVNYCDRRTNYPKIRFTRCEDQILTGNVKERKDTSYEVYLPSGTKVTIKINKSKFGLLDVFVDPSVLDKNSSIGLCGTLGNSKFLQARDDACAMRWRIGLNESLFDRNTLEKLEPWPRDDKLCSCQDEETLSGERTSTGDCIAYRVKICNFNDSISNSLMDYCIQSDRQRRELEYNITHGTTLPDLSPVQARVMPHQREERSIKYDENSAWQACITFMNTTGVHLCSTLPTIDLSPYIENCAKDIKLSNSLEWSSFHLEGLKHQCIQEARFNQPIPSEALEYINSTDISVYDPSEVIKADDLVASNNSFPITPKFLKDIEGVLCPNECSGNGKCVGGECICRTGLLGFDCSINGAVPPVITGIAYNGLCDKRARPCATTSILGRYFVSSGNLSCSLTEFTVDKNQTVSTTRRILVSAMRLSLVEAICDLPVRRHSLSTIPSVDESVVAEGYHISISNDGVHFSQSDSIIVYDSSCVRCRKLNGSIICELQKGHCILNGDCTTIGDKVGCLRCIDVANEGPLWISECSESSGTNQLWTTWTVLGSIAVMSARSSFSIV